LGLERLPAVNGLLREKAGTGQQSCIGRGGARPRSCCCRCRRGRHQGSSGLVRPQPLLGPVLVAEPQARPGRRPTSGAARRVGAVGRVTRHCRAITIPASPPPHLSTMPPPRPRRDAERERGTGPGLERGRPAMPVRPASGGLVVVRCVGGVAPDRVDPVLGAGLRLIRLADARIVVAEPAPGHVRPQRPASGRLSVGSLDKLTEHTHY
jgi:hypothetical protein